MENNTADSVPKSNTQIIIEIYILILWSIQMLLFINLIIYEFNKFFIKKDIKIVKTLQDNKNNINYYFLILTGILMLYLFNPFANPNGIHITSNLQSVLFSAAFLMLFFLLID
tara:strand:- start:1222 stop:1560 length:339 start_codon:yes stop_codon:yes gene_type:complete